MLCARQVLRAQRECRCHLVDGGRAKGDNALNNGREVDGGECGGLVGNDGSARTSWG